MGEFYNPTFSRAAHLKDLAADDGVLKEFFTSKLTKEYDIIKNPAQIDILTHCDWTNNEPLVFEASIGALDGGVITNSQHAVTAVGLITDPNETDFTKKYKAIIIIDSDNDATPTKEEAKTENPTEDEMDAAKSKRPNSATVYNLSYGTDDEGTPCWQIIDYDYKTGEPWVLYAIRSFPLYSDSIILANTETEGTRSVVNNVDLSFGTMFTTDRTEPIKDLWGVDLDEVTVTEFDEGSPVNFNFFIANKANINMDEEYRAGKDLLVSYSVIRDKDGIEVESGEAVCNDELFYNREFGFMINLGSGSAYKGGNYTIRLNLNPYRNITEAYYLNNIADYHFSVKGEDTPDEPVKPDEPVTPDKPITPDNSRDVVTDNSSDNTAGNTAAATTSNSKSTVKVSKAPKTGDRWHLW